MRQTHGQAIRAFTLVELLAGLAILAMLMSILFGVFNQASKAWTLAENRTETFQGARMALDLMARDLEGAITRTNSPAGGTTKITFIAFEDCGNANVAGAAIGVFTPSLANYNGTPPNDALFFITEAPDSKGKAYEDLAECGYYINFAASTGAGMKAGYYYLCRHYVRSHNATTGAVDPNWDFLTNPTGWYNTGSDSMVLENAIRLEFKYECADPNSATGTSAYDNWNTALRGPPTSLVADPSLQLPRAVNIRLTMLDRRFAARLVALNGFQSGDLANVPYAAGSLSSPMLAGVVREGARTFYRSVCPRGAQ